MLDDALVTHTGRGLPMEAAPLRFGSWIGGDRDGNPAVTAGVTETVCQLSRWQAASLYLREVDALRYELSMNDAGDELRARVGDADEPYRELLRDLRTRLSATLRTIEAWLAGTPIAPVPVIERAEDLAEPLRVCHRSLVETGDSVLAGGGCAICCGASRPLAPRWCASICGSTPRATRRR